MRIQRDVAATGSATPTILATILRSTLHLVQYYGEGNAGGRELDELVDVLQRSIAAIEAKEVNRGCNSPLGLIEPSHLAPAKPERGTRSRRTSAGCRPGNSHKSAISPGGWAELPDDCVQFILRFVEIILRRAQLFPRLLECCRAALFVGFECGDI